MDNDNLEHLKAQYEQPIQPKKSKKWRFILLGLLVLVLSAGIVVGGLELFKSKSNDTATAPIAEAGPGPDPRVIIDKIATNETVEGAANYTIFRTSVNATDASPDTTSIVYKQAGYSFLTNVAADDGLRFTLNSGATDKDAISTAIKKTLTDASFAVTTQDTTSLSAYNTVSYVNGSTVCQLINFANGKLVGLEQSILCITGKNLRAEYGTVAALLNKADTGIVASAKAVSQATITNGEKKLTTLTVQTDSSKNTTNYYFATLESNFDYIGKRATPSVDDESSYTISDELKKNITDPKWGTFLTDNIK
jgi:flagellar basal body-associated protein FliL